MTDKVQLIKQELEEIEQILDDYNKTHNDPIDNCIVSAEKNVCKQIKSFIDSLPEEPASEDLTHAAYHYANNLHMKRQIQIFEEKDVAADFIAGAEWQHGKDFDDLLQSEMKFPKEFYEKGRSDMREEMMNALVNGEVVKDIHNQLCVKSKSLIDTFGDVKFGDKVKIIIVKEEQQ